MPTILLLTASLLHATLSAAVEVSIDVSDRRGRALDGMIVYLLPEDAAEIPPATANAVMEQRDSRFIPHTLVVQTGTAVEFPNNDSVSHHVYSFSAARTFQLDLYRGNTHPPQLFATEGLVVLGCNIHDSMLGYILVVDTPWFGKSDSEGSLTLDVPAGSYQAWLWTPRVDADELPEPQQVVVADNAPHIEFSIQARLRPAHDSDSGLSWSDY